MKMFIDLRKIIHFHFKDFKKNIGLILKEEILIFAS